jgi:hypothetical protein
LEGVDAVIHLAAIIPPYSERVPDLARRVNLEGTCGLIAQMEESTTAKRLVFASSVGIFGDVQDRQPPLRVDTPVSPTDEYGRQKVACENAIRQSRLRWSILRLAAVTPIHLQAQDPSIMFDFSPEARFEFLHPADAVAAVLADLPPAIRAEVEAVGRALRSGGDGVAAWRQARLLTSADALAAGFQVCEDSGASLATVLARLAVMAADDRRRRDEVAVSLAGPRSSAVLLAGLPALGVLAGAAIGASPLPFLLRTPAGQLCLLLGVGLDVLGAWWVARLAASAGWPQRLP